MPFHGKRNSSLVRDRNHSFQGRPRPHRSSRSPSGSSAGGTSSNGSERLGRSGRRNELERCNSYGNQNGRPVRSPRESIDRQFRPPQDDYLNSEQENWDHEPSVFDFDLERNGYTNGHSGRRDVSENFRERTPSQFRSPPRSENRSISPSFWHKPSRYRSPSPPFEERRLRNRSPSPRFSQRSSRRSPSPRRRQSRNVSPCSTRSGHRHSPSPRRGSVSPQEHNPCRPRSPSPLEAHRPRRSRTPSRRQTGNGDRVVRIYNTEEENWDVGPSKNIRPSYAPSSVPAAEPPCKELPKAATTDSRPRRVKKGSELNSEDSKSKKKISIERQPGSGDIILGIKIKQEKVDEDDKPIKVPEKPNSYFMGAFASALLAKVKTEEIEPGEVSPSPPPEDIPGIPSPEPPLKRQRSFSPMEPQERRRSHMSASSSTSSSTQSRPSRPRDSVSPEPLIARTVKKRVNSDYDPRASNVRYSKSDYESTNAKQYQSDHNSKRRRVHINNEKRGTYGFDVYIGPESEDPNPPAVILPPPPPIPQTVPTQPRISVQIPNTIPIPQVSPQFGNLSTASPCVGLGPLGLLPHQIATLLPHQLVLLAQMMDPSIQTQLTVPTAASNTVVPQVQIPATLVPAPSPASLTHSQTENSFSTHEIANDVRNRMSSTERDQRRHEDLGHARYENQGRRSPDPHEETDENGHLIPHRVLYRSKCDDDENWEPEVPVRKPSTRSTTVEQNSACYPFGFELPNHNIFRTNGTGGETGRNNAVIPNSLVFDYGHGSTGYP